MRLWLIILLTFMTFGCFAQSRTFLDGLLSQLNASVDSILDRDNSARIGVTLDSLGDVSVSWNYSKASDTLFLQKLYSIALPFRDEMDSQYVYSFHFIKDEYSNRLFSTYTVDYKAVSFTNYHVPPYYPGGIDTFLKIIFADIGRNMDRSDIDNYDWDKPFRFIVTAEGNVQLVKDNNWVGLIDLVTTAKWKPAIEYGVPISMLIQLNPFNKGVYQENGVITADNLYHSTSFSETFRNKPVLVSYRPPVELMDSLVVSFVLEGAKLWEPVILKGDPQLGIELIQAINRAAKDETFRIQYLYPQRVYFLLKD